MEMTVDSLSSTTLSDELDLLITKQTRILIEDADNHRSIFHQLNSKSLFFYELLNSFWFRSLFRSAILVSFLLPIVEWPSSLTRSSDSRITLSRPKAPCGVTESIELLCLLIVFSETLLIIRVFGLSWLKKNPWIYVRLILLIIYLIDFTLSLSLKCTDFYRIRRFIRPYFLISSSQLMKKLLKCLKRTLPKLLSTLFLLLLWLVSSTLVALCAFSEPQNDSGVETGTDSSTQFPNFYTSMFHLLVLITTANHPDVIIKPYNKNRCAAIFSFVFLGVGLYVFMNILTAVVYSEVRGYLKSSVKARLARRRVATRAAFELLRLADYSEDGEPNVVTRDRIIQLIDTVRISSWKKETLKMAYISQFAEGNLGAAEFMRLFRILDLSAPPVQESCLRTVPQGFPKKFQIWITSPGFAKLSIAVSVLNLINMAIDMDNGFSSTHWMNVEMRIINWCFVAFYLFEEFAFMWAVGRKAFFKKWSNVFSLSTILLLLTVKMVESGFLIIENRGHTAHILEFTLLDAVRLANLLLLTRTARIVHLFTWTQLVAGVLSDLRRDLAPVLGIFISIYYTYALLGMNVFHDVLRYEANSSAAECGTYQQLEYWSINFDDFLASIVVLWDLMVVNNWFVIVEAYQKAVGVWAHIYMISWWLIAVVGLLSLVTALVIEVFVYRRDQHSRALTEEEQQREMVRGRRVTTVTPSRPAPTTPVDEHYSTTTDNTDSNAATLSTSDFPGSYSHSLENELVHRHQCRHLYQRAFDGASFSFDNLFSGGLQEPTEEELLLQVDQHPGIQKMRQLIAESVN